MGGSLLVSDAVADRFGAEIARVAPGLALEVVRRDGTPDLSDVAAAYFSYDVFPERAREFAIHALKAESLRWLHTFSAGVDNKLFQILLDRGVRLTTSSGAMAVPIAQTVMMYLLALSRNLPGWLDDQRARRWNSREIADLQGRTLLVVGLGPIGWEVARLGREFGMDVVGLRRKPRGDEPCPTHPLDALYDWLPRADAVVLAVPLAPGTHGMIDAKALAAMKPGAFLANVGRGEVVDEAALVEALRSGHLGGAALDVFEVEPLPEESPLWSLPNVIVTPHSSGTNPGNHARATEIFLENLGRFARGERPLRNEVEPPVGGSA